MISTSTLQILLVLYVASGVLQPILVEILHYNGACDRSTLLFLLPNYIGMSFSIFSNWGARNQGVVRWGPIVGLCAVDIFSQLCIMFGLVYAGSLLFSILYSSCTVWTAVFSNFFLGKKLHWMQWFGVLIVFIGLTLGLHGSISIGNYEVSLGIFLILLGSMFHSLSYIIAETILSRVSDPIAPEMLTTIMGLSGAIIYGLWQIIYTVPRFETVVVEQIAINHGDIAIILLTYVFLTFDDLLHGLCFFHLIGSVGATTTGAIIL